MRLLNYLLRKLFPQIYWDLKYPKIVVQHTSRFIPQVGSYAVDVRAFFVNSNSYEIQKIVEPLKKLSSDDEKAKACLKYVRKSLTYISDKKLFGLPEYWCYPQETLHIRRGDCDDGTILLANLMVASGIPEWKVRIACGLTHNNQGHAIVTYYANESQRWTGLDWTKKYEPLELYNSYKQILKTVWFSFTKKQAYGVIHS